MIDHEVYDTATLLGTLEEFEPVPNYWLNLAFPGEVRSDDEFIDFGKINHRRKVAPLVVPTAQGKPMYSAAERHFRVKPAYLKPKDAVSAARMIRKVAGIGELSPNPYGAISPAQRYQAVVTDILREHWEGIQRRWELMAAEAVITGKVTLSGDAYPTTVVDFERAANHTVVLTGGDRWGQTGVSITSNIETWRKRVRDAEFGGPTNRLTVGSNVWEVMRHDDELLELLDTQIRNNSGASLNLGIRDGLDVEFVGKLSSTLDLYVYSDYYEDEDGNTQPFMSPDDVVLTGPNIQGVRGFGAILDKGANFAPLPFFPKMFDQEDPSVTFVLSQSAPLMIPLNPNNTLRATVL